MLAWQKKIRKLEEEIKELELKLHHPHLIKSAEEDYDIKSQIIKRQNEIISIYVVETQRLMREGGFHDK
jgi:hypothetical protein